MAKERSKGVVRLIGVFKLVKATLLVLLAFGVLRALHGGLADTVHEIAKALRVDPHAEWMTSLVAKVSGISPERMRLLGIGTLVYAALFTVEGIGLLALRVWAEWLTVVSTAGFIPLELVLLVRHVSASHVATLVINVLVVVYLLVNRLRERGKPSGDRRGASVERRRSYLAWLSLPRRS